MSEEQLKALPARTRSPERVQQSLDAFALHLQGVSDRGVQQHFGWKSLSTAQNSIRRGEEIAKKLNLDTEKIRLKIAAAFDFLADVTIAQVKEQAESGRVTQIAHSDGTQEVRRQKGVDPRMLGEAGRGLIRFAEFAGLMDRATEVNAGEVSQNVVFISPSETGAAWDQQAATIDVSAVSGHVGGHADPEPPAGPQRVLKREASHSKDSDTQSDS